MKTSHTNPPLVDAAGTANQARRAAAASLSRGADAARTSALPFVVMAGLAAAVAGLVGLADGSAELDDQLLVAGSIVVLSLTWRLGGMASHGVTRTVRTMKRADGDETAEG